MQRKLVAANTILLAALCAFTPVAVPAHSAQQLVEPAPSPASPADGQSGYLDEEAGRAESRLNPHGARFPFAPTHLIVGEPFDATNDYMTIVGPSDLGLDDASPVGAGYQAHVTFTGMSGTIHPTGQFHNITLITDANGRIPAPSLSMTQPGSGTMDLQLVTPNGQRLGSMRFTFTGLDKSFQSPVSPATARVLEGEQTTLTVNISPKLNPGVLIAWQTKRVEDSNRAWTEVPENADSHGTTSRTLTLTGTQTALTRSGDEYRVILHDPSASATIPSLVTQPTRMDVQRFDSSRVSQDLPEAVTVREGDNAVWHVAGTGTPAPTVQWQTSTAFGAWNDVATNASGNPNELLLTQVQYTSHNALRIRAILTNVRAGVQYSVHTRISTLLVNPSRVPTPMIFGQYNDVETGNLILQGTGISGATIRLFRTGNIADGASVVAQTTVDSNGQFFLSTSLRNGTVYLVQRIASTTSPSLSVDLNDLIEVPRVLNNPHESIRSTVSTLRGRGTPFSTVTLKLVGTPTTKFIPVLADGTWEYLVPVRPAALRGASNLDLTIHGSKDGTKTEQRSYSFAWDGRDTATP